VWVSENFKGQDNMVPSPTVEKFEHFQLKTSATLNMSLVIVKDHTDDQLPVQKVAISTVLGYIGYIGYRG
jgi:hypothetical protein